MCTTQDPTKPCLDTPDQPSLVPISTPANKAIMITPPVLPPSGATMNPGNVGMKVFPNLLGNPMTGNPSMAGNNIAGIPQITPSLPEQPFILLAKTVLGNGISMVSPKLLQGFTPFVNGVPVALTYPQAVTTTNLGGGNPPPPRADSLPCPAMIPCDDFNGGPTNTGGGGSETGPNTGNWVPPGSGGSGGGGANTADANAKKQAYAQNKLLNEIINGINHLHYNYVQRDKTMITQPWQGLITFEESTDAALYDEMDDLIDQLTGNDKLNTILQVLATLIGFLSPVIASLSAILAYVNKGQYVPAQLAKVRAFLNAILHTMVDILRQQDRLQMANKILANCPPLSGDICIQAQFDNADATNRLSMDQTLINGYLQA